MIVPTGFRSTYINFSYSITSVYFPINPLKHHWQHQHLGWKPGREPGGVTNKSANSTDAAALQEPGLQVCFPPAMLWAIKLLDILLQEI